MRVIPNMNLIQKETVTPVFTITDKDGDAVDVSGATITGWVKRSLDEGTAYLFQIPDADWNKSVGGASNAISATFSESDMDFNEKAYLIVLCDVSATSKPKFVVQMTVLTSPE